VHAAEFSRKRAVGTLSHTLDFCRDYGLIGINPRPPRTEHFPSRGIDFSHPPSGLGGGASPGRHRKRADARLHHAARIMIFARPGSREALCAVRPFFLLDLNAAANCSVGRASRRARRARHFNPSDRCCLRVADHVGSYRRRKSSATREQDDSPV